jgi:hypothetical protein
MTIIKIFLCCAFGEDVSEKQIDYYVNGRKTQKTLAYSLRKVFQKCVDRLISV